MYRRVWPRIFLGIALIVVVAILAKCGVIDVPNG